MSFIDRLWTSPKRVGRIPTVPVMEILRQTQKKYCTRAIGFAFFGFFCFYLVGWIDVGKGLILGTLFSILNFILMGETLPMRIGVSTRKTFFFSLGSMCFRYILLAIPIVMAIKLESFNLYSVICGIFMIQVLLLGDHIINLFLSQYPKQV